METKIIQIQELSIEDLMTVIQNSIREELNTFTISQKQSTATKKLLSRSEVMELLKISEVTLYNYEKQGKIKGYGIGGRRLYKEEEILNALVEKK